MNELPDGLQLVRKTSTFDESTVPPGLLAEHRIASGVWGRLVVESGVVDFDFVFDEHADAGVPHRLEAGDRQVIPPNVAHHIVIGGSARLHIEFHR